MSRGVLLVGASGLAREVLAAAPEGIVGIADDDPALHGRDIAGCPVIGSIREAAARADDLLVCVGPSRARRSIVRRLHAWGVGPERFATFRAPSARIGRTSTVGAGSILLDGVVITADATIGRHVVLMPHCTVTHDVVIDDFATLAAGVALGGSVRVGEAAYLGMNVSVRQGLRIGADATVGMGAVVIRSVPPDETWVGIPASRLGAAVMA